MSNKTVSKLLAQKSILFRKTTLVAEIKQFYT